MSGARGHRATDAVAGGAARSWDGGGAVVSADHVGAGMSGASGAPLDIALGEMRRRWGPEWLVWRSRDAAGEPNEWCATRRGRGRELSMTLMEPTVGALEKALVRQADRSPIHG